MVLLPDGRRLLTGTQKGKIDLFDVVTQQRLKSFIGNGNWVHRLAVSPDGRQLALATKQSAIVWDLASGRQQYALDAAGLDVDDLAFHPRTGQLIVCGSSITLCAADSGEPQAELAPKTTLGYHSLSVSSGGPWISAALADTLTVWDGQGKEIGSFKLAHRISASALSPKGRWLAACSAGAAVHVWSLPEGELVGKFESGDSRHVDHIAFSHDDRLLLTGDSLRGTQIWDIGSQRRVAEFSDSEHHAHSLATSPTSPLWAAANGTTIRIGALPAP